MGCLVNLATPLSRMLIGFGLMRDGPFGKKPGNRPRVRDNANARSATDDKCLTSHKKRTSNR
jgi:hypothetical protein